MSNPDDTALLIPHDWLTRTLESTFEIVRADGLTAKAASRTEAELPNLFHADEVQAWAAARKLDKAAQVPVPPPPPEEPGQFAYRPLLDDKDIRVIELQPGSGDDPVRCALRHCSVAHAHQNMADASDEAHYALDLGADPPRPVWYTALSYTWGTNVMDTPIFVDDSPKKITKPLLGILRQLRDETQTLVLWIDQICINQADDAEKARQVPLMGRVYTKAVNTLVWLGDDTATSDKAFRLLEHVVVSLLYASEQPGPADSLRDTLDRLGLPTDPKDEGWRAVWELLSRAWFGRMWIVQEVILSRNACLGCGRERMDWDKFNLACMNLEAAGVSRWLREALDDDKEKEDRCRVVQELDVLKSITSSGRDGGDKLWFLMPETRRSGCYDPRDKVYGLLGVTKSPWVTVSYAPDNSWQRLYLDVATRFMRTMPELLLGAVDHEFTVTDPALPSWVPDWRKPRRTAQLSASKGPYFFVRELDYVAPRVNGLELCVSGRLFGSVTGVGVDFGPSPDINYEDPAVKNRDVLVAAAHVAKNLGESYPDCLPLPGTPESKTENKKEKRKDTTERKKESGGGGGKTGSPLVSTTVFEAFWRTLVANTDDKVLQAAPDAWEEVFSILLDASADWTAPSLPGQTYSRRQTLPVGHKGRLGPDDLGRRTLGVLFQEARTALRRALRNRRMVVTDNGYLALVPNWARKGDMVVALDGFMVPHLVRPVPEPEPGRAVDKGEVAGEVRRGRLLGECYVHGIMGLGLEKAQPGELSTIVLI